MMHLKREGMFSILSYDIVMRIEIREFAYEISLKTINYQRKSRELYYCLAGQVFIVKRDFTIPYLFTIVTFDMTSDDLVPTPTWLLM